MWQVALWIAMELAMSQVPASPAKKQNVDFRRDIQPIFERNCQPCHFPGGSMHAKLPFDKAETIHELGTKLFTRIKKDDEQKVIRAFLASGRK